MTVALYPNLTRENGFEISSAVIDELISLGIDIIMPCEYEMKFEGKKIYKTIDSKITNKIKSMSKEMGITPYMFLLAGYYIMLSKYTAQDDIVIGSPIVGREYEELYNVIGMFVNTLPLE